MFTKKEITINEMDLIAQDELTHCKCLHCGYEQDVPSWLVSEICELNDECGFDDHFITGCYKCNRDTMVTIQYYYSIK